MFAPGQVIDDESSVTEKTRHGKQAVQICDCAAALKIQDGVEPRIRRDYRPVLDSMHVSIHNSTMPSPDQI